MAGVGQGQDPLGMQLALKHAVDKVTHLVNAEVPLRSHRPTPRTVLQTERLDIFGIGATNA